LLNARERDARRRAPQPWSTARSRPHRAPMTGVECTRAMHDGLQKARRKKESAGVWTIWRVVGVRDTRGHKPATLHSPDGYDWPTTAEDTTLRLTHAVVQTCMQDFSGAVLQYTNCILPTHVDTVNHLHCPLIVSGQAAHQPRAFSKLVLYFSCFTDVAFAQSRRTRSPSRFLVRACCLPARPMEQGHLVW
jgi:hypothetical protein